MSEIKLGWKIVLRVWWASFWRSAIGTLVLLIALLVSNNYIFSFAASVLHFPPILITIINVVFTCVFSVGISLVVTRNILNKNYGNFRLSVVANESNVK